VGHEIHNKASVDAHRLAEYAPLMDGGRLSVIVSRLPLPFDGVNA
jgi:hypothetical protein